MRKTKRLWDAYRFPGFTPEPGVSGIFGDPKSLVIKLRRRGKKRFAGVADGHTGRYAELGEIVNGSRPGRESDTEITIYESLGFAALDLAVAIAVYEKSMELGLGTKLSL
jgi:hypothetical protein